MGDEDERIARLFETAIGKQVEATARAISAGDSVDDAFDPAPVRDAYRETWLTVAPLFAGYMFDALEDATKEFSEDDLAAWETAATEYVEGQVANEKIKLVNDTTRDFFRSTVSTGIESGMSAQQVANLVTDRWDELKGFRSMRIARTEIVGAANFGSLQGAQSTGLDLVKVWVTTPDNRTRDTHRLMSGSRAPIGEPFDNGLDHPGDPSGPAGEIINCRCTMRYEVL